MIHKWILNIFKQIPKTSLPLDFNMVGGVAIAETYKRCQFIAIVGGGEKPRFAENTGI